MEKKEQTPMNPIALRSLNDLQYAFFCVNCATRYLDARSKNVKDSRNALMEAMNNFFMSVNACYVESESHE